MAENLIDLRRRIKSVVNTQKITRAMKTVSASKLRRSVSELNKTRPMMEKIAALLTEVSRTSHKESNPFLEERKTGTTIFVIISADKGLCGAFNTHVITAAEQHYQKASQYEKETDHTTIITVGNKAFKHFEKRKYSIKKNYPSFMSKLQIGNAIELSAYLQNIYLDKEEHIKKIEFILNRYVSASRQEITVTPLFPIQNTWKTTPPPDHSNTVLAETDPYRDKEYIFEPSAEAIFQALLPKYINSLVYQVLLQSASAEHAARMIAMEQATNNANDMLRSLTLTMNKLRQASITNEILEIITATEALQK